MLTRHVAVAILAFTALIFANVAVFSHFYFRSFSQKIVREHLVAALNEAQTLLDRSLWVPQGSELTECDVSDLITPKLRQMRQFQALVVYDAHGTVIHREMLRVNTNKPASSALPLKVPVDMVGPAAQIGVEYDAEALEREVANLRKDLSLKLQLALTLSLAFLLCGAAYVIWVYKRGQKLMEDAQRADRLAYVGTLASGLAHEIRNPLNSMNMNIQLIEEEIQEIGLGTTDEIYEMFSSTRREIQRLERLVSSFLSYAKPTKMQLVEANVNGLVEDIVKFLNPDFERGQVRLDLNLGAGLPAVSIDEAQIRQALLNIIQNAVQVSAKGQTVYIKTRLVAGDKILVSIRDEGPGIAPEELEQIFKVFYSTKRGGSGLGLPIAQRIAELHRGGIKAESQVGHGTTMTLILPKANQA